LEHHFGKWRLDDRLGQSHERLREEVRQAEGRTCYPSGAVIDSKALEGIGVGGPERGIERSTSLTSRGSASFASATCVSSPFDI
jgi:hypothetical protein